MADIIDHMQELDILITCNKSNDFAVRMAEIFGELRRFCEDIKKWTRDFML